MRVIHQLLVNVADARAAGLLHHWRSFLRDGAFLFSDAKAAAKAAAEAAASGLTFERFYAVIADPERLEEYPGYYVSVDVVEPLLAEGRINSTALGDAQIAKDTETEKLWIDDAVRGLLPDSIRTRSIGDRWHVIESMPEMPEPIRIPKPVFIGANVAPAAGTFVVQSDGRDCLTPAAASFLKQNGLCRSTRAATPDGDYAMRPRYLFSATLVERLFASRIRGLSEQLVPLIDVDAAAAMQGD